MVEGPSLIAQAIDAGWEVIAQYVAPHGEPVGSSGTIHHLGPNVIERVASTTTPQPVLAEVAMRDLPVPERPSFVVVVDQLSDPGNAGTIIRCAEAAGAEAVLLTPGSVDVYNPKVVRASAGSLFRVPLATMTWAQIGMLGAATTATSSHHGEVYTDVDLTVPVAIVLGNEAHGLSPDAAVQRWVTIPQQGQAESLNVAMAGAVLLFEVARQRRRR